MDLIDIIKKRFSNGEYAVSDHAIIEARKDGIEPKTIEKLEWIAIHGDIIEEYTERKRILVWSSLMESELPVHIVIDYSFIEEPVIITAYVPNEKYWIKNQIRK